MPRKVMVVTTAWGANGATAGLAAEAIKERNLQTALGFGRVIDITGRVLGQTTRSARLVAQEIDLEKRLFHTDYNLGKIALIRQKLGRSVEIVQYSDENYFTLESHDAAWPVARIAREWEMETFREYHARATCVQDEAREAAAHR